MYDPPLTSRRTSRVVVAHPDEPGVDLVGTLEQVAGLASPPGPRPIALILHGVMGHKDYLWQKQLAHALPLDSFRFDFRSNHESGGRWNFAGFPNEVRDIEAVVRHLNTTRKYRVALIVAHSRGSLVAFRWLCTSPLAGQISAFVNISARYRMEKVYDKAGFSLDDLEPGKDYYVWRAMVARKPREEKVYQQDIDAFAAWDTSLVVHSFPKHIHVLTVHGLADDLVSPIDATMYHRALRNRGSQRGTSQLFLVDGANHTFNNDRSAVTRAVLGWLSVPDARRHSGLWLGSPSADSPMLKGDAEDVLIDDVVESFRQVEYREWLRRSMLRLNMIESEPRAKL